MTDLNEERFKSKIQEISSLKEKEKYLEFSIQKRDEEISRLQEYNGELMEGNKRLTKLASKLARHPTAEGTEEMEEDEDEDEDDGSLSYEILSQRKMLTDEIKYGRVVVDQVERELANCYRKNPDKMPETTKCYYCCAEVYKDCIGTFELGCGHILHLKCWHRVIVNEQDNTNLCPYCKVPMFSDDEVELKQYEGPNQPIGSIVGASPGRPSRLFRNGV
jgi:hypothetical protein